MKLSSVPRSVVAVAMGCVLLAAVGCAGAVETTKAPQVVPRKGPFELLDGISQHGDGFVINWLVCGPFPNPGGRTSIIADVIDVSEGGCAGWNVDYLKSAGGEGGIEPFDGMRIQADGKTWTWTAYEPLLVEAVIDFLSVFWDEFHGGGFEPTHTLAYAACYVESDRPRDILVKVGSDDGFKVWLNHELLLEQHLHRGCVPDDDSVPAHLEAGSNLLLLKVDTDVAGFRFVVRLTDTAGKPLKDVTISN